MSAREELIEALLPSYRSQWAHGEEEAAIAVVDAYAHELAERIRNSDLPASRRDMACGPLCSYIDGSDDAADLIDPEVK